LNDDLRAHGIGLESLSENLETSSPFGEFSFHILASVAHLERRIIVERTQVGLAAAKRRGQALGRKQKLDDEALTHAYLSMLAGQDISVIVRHFGAAPITLKRGFVRMGAVV